MNATALLIPNEIAKNEEKIKFKIPATTSETYRLGITMSELFLHVLVILKAQCHSESGRKILDLFIKQEEKDLEALSFHFKYALNCEIAKFYQFRGEVVNNELPAGLMSETKLLITRNLENFFAWMQEIEKSFSSFPAPDITKYFHTQTKDDVLATCLKARNNIIELYRRLAKLYPEGNISSAFMEMAEILEEGNKNLLS
ncbi:hypothetical protein SAMN02745221_01089 [Thermosyntropha lipolytica DSM 11003]|uniref:Uncharacterized protein n=1 Tax=Thermosyntropha lipolytica DSM 11003 TaxID=1123382 RepID=A0A1M5N2W4_9FIRM|nr:hypothetical protein [Thermosyntropha lipolytica]SHG83900.1 hypothetical protein SAMN02745221_01089 [Thermosyntropha lipolytica DSM 11003]